MITHLVGNNLGLGLVPDIAIPSDGRRKVIEVNANWLDCSYEIHLHQAKTGANSMAVRTVAEIVQSQVGSFGNS
jgi:hypothetical protein